VVLTVGALVCAFIVNVYCKLVSQIDNLKDRLIGSEQRLISRLEKCIKDELSSRKKKKETPKVKVEEGPVLTGAKRKYYIG
jgi:hypothetical protein